MTSSAFLFAHDILDEGVEVVLDRLAAAGLDGVTMAAAYHHSRDVFPHNPRQRVVYLEGGVVYFQAQMGSYSGIRPRIAQIAQDVDPLAVLTQAAHARGIKSSAWLVVLHNTRLAFEHPDCAPVTALGDPLLNSLCPANPTVKHYATALAADVARYNLDAIKLEAASFMPFDHGYHHERSFVRLGPNVRFSLGLCFCEHCLSASSDAGVDGERVRRTVADSIQAVFDSSTAETFETDVQAETVRAMADAELGRYLDVRQTTVSALVGDIAGAVHRVAPETRVIFLDLSGATLGYATGRPSTEQTATSIAWRDGIDLQSIARCADGLGMLGYFAEPARLESELAAYRGLVPPDRGLEVILRPMPPDVDSADALSTKVASLRRAGVEDVSFYHYGFMRLENLDWIRQALASA